MIMPPPTSTALSSSLAQFEHLPVAIAERLNHLPTAIATTSDAAIWNRSLPPAVENWLDGIAPRNLPDGRYIVKPSNVAASIETLFAAQRLATTLALTWLSKDAEQLSHCVCRIARTQRVRLRLERVDDNACSKLHMDDVVARMICTYRGPSTQLGFETSVSDEIQMVPTGMPVLLKGKRWPGHATPALRHRSPQIEGTGITRLVLVLEGVSPEDIMPTYDTLYEEDERARID
ncbi:MAG: DUF1826 domain-containing protein [Henriciella sp.]|jgi:hypothetical protein